MHMSSPICAKRQDNYRATLCAVAEKLRAEAADAFSLSGLYRGPNVVDETVQYNAKLLHQCRALVAYSVQLAISGL